MKALLSFFTVFPVRGASLEEAAREVRLLPLVGLVTGLPGAGPATGGPPGASWCSRHARARGRASRRWSAPRRRRPRRGRRLDGPREPGPAPRGARDTRVGIGGLGALFLVYAPTVGALAALCATSPGRAALALFAGEVAARSAMLLVLAFGEPADPRSSSVPFVRALSGPRRTPAVVVALLAPLPFLLPSGALCAARRPRCTPGRAWCPTGLQQ